MPSPPIEIKPLERPFDITFPDVEKGIPPIPGSKSLTNRALLLAALAEGASTLTGVLFSDDTRVMMQALKDLGFTLDIDEGSHTVTVHGQGGIIPAKEAKLHLGNAGTAMRFLTAACCLGEPGSVYELDGIPRMRERPIGELVEPLRQLGANIEYLGEVGYPPLRIHGGIKGGEVKVHNTLSSQYISAMMMIGPLCPNGLTLDLGRHITSHPYVNLTAAAMEDFWVPGAFFNLNTHRVTIKPKQYSARLNYAIEPDASNASYFYAAAAATLGASVCIRELHWNSYQGDTKIAQVFRDMGASIEEGNDDDRFISVCHADALHPPSADFQDMNDIPDAAMTIATLAVLANGPTTIRNVGNWRVKETDRMAAMQAELTKLGATVEVNGDDITINPPASGKITPAAIDTYDDHRMAMAFTVIGLAQPGVTINDPDCVNKTFPDFFKYLDYLRQTAID